MTCIQHCYGPRRPRAAETRSADAPARSDGLPSVLSGTWDFKWPVGTTIRVAFQALPADVDPKLLVDGMRLVREKLDAWLRQPQAPNLDYQILDALMPPPPVWEQEDQARNRPRPARSAGGSLEYDVLISFLPLPVRLPETEQHPVESFVMTSASELGHYAERIEYGVPTMYLGPWSGFGRSWFDTVEGEFAVVHELGHALGMPHEQQNPGIKNLPWKTKEEMLAILANRPGLAPGADLEAFIDFEIVDRWPGEPRFSDWRVPAAVPPNYDFDSVMAKPSYQCLLRGVHDPKICTPGGCEILNQALAELKTPTATDLDHLVYMYGPRPKPVRMALVTPVPPSAAVDAAQ